ncbi:unnamed protein product [Adineta ricciae]|uniref:Uncharacterized protein n=1 Tax=Adineta ricciae TaxID=249248 RepID=A0A814L6A1_ADIRI|nr:unnamed protein product [Adineta ricciae]
MTSYKNHTLCHSTTYYCVIDNKSLEEHERAIRASRDITCLKLDYFLPLSNRTIERSNTHSIFIYSIVTHIDQ